MRPTGGPGYPSSFDWFKVRCDVVVFLDPAYIKPSGNAESL
jgi:hypothetical protein